MAITTVLTKLFNIMQVNGIVPDSLATNYTVSMPKCDIFGKALTVSDIRGISICPIISNLFKHCIFDRYSTFLVSSDN